MPWKTSQYLKMDNGGVSNLIMEFDDVPDFNISYKTYILYKEPNKFFSRLTRYQHYLPLNWKLLLKVVHFITLLVPQKLLWPLSQHKVYPFHRLPLALFMKQNVLFRCIANHQDHKSYLNHYLSKSRPPWPTNPSLLHQTECSIFAYCWRAALSDCSILIFVDLTDK